MTYGKRPGLDVKLMRAMKPSQEIVIHDISQVDFYSNLTYTVRLRAATTQIVGTQAPTPCKRCENTTWPFTECVRVPTMARGCCGNCLWSKDPVQMCSFVHGTYSNATGIL